MHVRTRVLVVVVAAVGLFAGVSAVAIAASPHFKRGGSPVCTISGSGSNSTSTTCTASLSGLGSGDLDINTTVSGSAVYQCQNPGGNIAPGQNRVLVGPVTEPTTIPGSAIKNGNATLPGFNFSFSLSTPTPEQAGCPNDQNWTVTFGSATWTASYVVEQPNVINSLSFSF